MHSLDQTDHHPVRPISNVPHSAHSRLAGASAMRGGATGRNLGGCQAGVRQFHSRVRRDAAQRFMASRSSVDQIHTNW